MTATARTGQLAESGETYLETILLMQQANPGKPVRAVDVANLLHYSKPSVSRAIGLLRDRRLLCIGSDGGLDFTPQGRECAERVLERHRQLTVLLTAVAGVSAAVAERDACRIEHVISDETMNGIQKYLSEHGLLAGPRKEKADAAAKS